MDYLQQLLEGNQLPFLTALILGLMTAISPCPLATNITATAFISKNITDKKMVFVNGIVYSLGRAFSYSVIGVVLYFGADQFNIAKFMNQNGERYLGPFLVILGLVMLNVIKLNFLDRFNIKERLADKVESRGVWGSFMIGVIFALAFCPYSGALYFGMLIPLTISSASGLYLPVVFAFGTGLPVIIFSYLLAFTAGKVGSFYNRVGKIEKVMRLFAAILSIGAGLYYIKLFFFG